MALKKHDTAPVSRGTGFDLSLLDEKELLALRSQIDTLLDIGHLGDLNVGQEIMVQLRTLKMLQHEALTDSDVPVNQRAQAANTVSAMLRDLVKTRAKLFDAERAKAIEDFTIEAMKDAPEEAKALFFERLERLLATLPTMDSLLAEADAT